MSTYLITGGSGFIGSNLVAMLLAKGETIRVLDNFATGQRSNLKPFADQIDIVEGDIRSYHLVRDAVQGVDYVLHQAALPSVPRSVRDPITTNEVNVLGTLNLLQAARDAGVKRLVAASSSSLYGDSKVLPKEESMASNPLSPYAISKLAAEQYCQSFSRIYGFETVCLRYFNVFGPRQDPNSQYSAVIPRFITRILNDEPITIHGDGSQSRDFSFIDNVTQANYLATTASNVSGEVINVACGARHTLVDLIGLISQLTGKEPTVSYTESRAGDVSHSQADIGKARRLLGYEPAVDVKTGLEQTIQWFQQNQSNGHR